MEEREGVIKVKSESPGELRILATAYGTVKTLLLRCQ